MFARLSTLISIGRGPKLQALGHRLQLSAQLGLALPDPVSDFAAVESRESWAGKLAPGVSLKFLQCIYVAT